MNLISGDDGDGKVYGAMVAFFLVAIIFGSIRDDFIDSVKGPLNERVEIIAVVDRGYEEKRVIF